MRPCSLHSTCDRHLLRCSFRLVEHPSLVLEPEWAGTLRFDLAFCVRFALGGYSALCQLVRLFPNKSVEARVGTQDEEAAAMLGS